MNVTDITAHRPWPMPSGPWVMKQVWHDLLFAHWPMTAVTMRALVPSSLELDTFRGEAWVGIVPFRMSGVRPRCMPALPWLSGFPELNLRTYVTLDDKPGVWFFTLEASQPIAVALARSLFHLPYRRARMSAEREGQNVRYSSVRMQCASPSAEFSARYGPRGSVYASRPSTLEHWLTERYCMYAIDGRERVWRGEIHHPPWPLQPAVARIEKNTLARAHAIELSDCGPLLHFSRRHDVVVWAPKIVRG